TGIMLSVGVEGERGAGALSLEKGESGGERRSLALIARMSQHQGSRGFGQSTRFVAGTVVHQQYRVTADTRSFDHFADAGLGLETGDDNPHHSPGSMAKVMSPRANRRSWIFAVAEKRCSAPKEAVCWVCRSMVSPACA